MRVGLFTDTFPPDVNGVANSTRILYEELRKHGHEAFVVAPYPGVGGAKWDETHTIMRLAGVTLKQLYGYTMTSPFHVFALNEVKKLDLDIIHDQTEFGVGIFAHICAKQLGIPLVSTYHTTYEDYTHYINIINSNKVDEEAKKAIAYMSRVYGDSCLEVIAPSSKTKDLLERYHVHSDIRIVPTGLQLDAFDPKDGTAEKRHEIRAKYGISDTDSLIIYVGRIAEEKSLDLVVRGFQKAKEAGCRSKFLVVGGGPDQQKLTDLSIQLGLEGTVIFAGKQPSTEMPDYYRSADAFVSASLSETQGMTFIEAMASGLPLFARYDNVLDDILIPDHTGWFFEHEEDFAEKLKHFEALGTEQRKTLTANCLEQVHPYSADVFYDRAIQVYEDAIHLYETMQIVDDVEVKDDYVQLYFRSPQDEETRLMISLDKYYSEGLRKGRRLTNQEIKDIEHDETGVKAYQGCMRRIAIKDRTRKEIYDWLTQNTECDIETINNIVDKLESKGYINDERYCEECITRMKLALQGEDKIISELKKRGISYDMIREKLDARPNDELDNAREYAKKCADSIRNESVSMKKKKIRAKMIQRGFKSELASQAIGEMDFMEDESHELDSLRKCALKARKRYEKKYESTQLRNTVYRYCAAQGYNSEDIYAILDEMEWNDQ